MSVIHSKSTRFSTVALYSHGRIPSRRSRSAARRTSQPNAGNVLRGTAQSANNKPDRRLQKWRDYSTVMVCENRHSDRKTSYRDRTEMVRRHLRFPTRFPHLSAAVLPSQHRHKRGSCNGPTNVNSPSTRPLSTKQHQYPSKNQHEGPHHRRGRLRRPNPRKEADRDRPLHIPDPRRRQQALESYFFRQRPVLCRRPHPALRM